MSRQHHRDVSCESLERRRLLSAGQLAPTFGAGGIATFDFGGNERAYSVLPSPGGKLLVYGRSDSPTTPVPVFRIHADGALDATFGDGGRLVTNNFPWKALKPTSTFTTARRSRWRSSRTGSSFTSARTAASVVAR